MEILRPLILTASLAIMWAQPVHGQTGDPSTARNIEALQERALADDRAYDFARRITTEIGPRMPGTEQEARARTWAAEHLRQAGFSKVRVEEFALDRVWLRGKESGAIVAPYPQKIALTALGNSGATSDKGLVGEVRAFPDLAALKASDPSEVQGKIVYIGHALRPTQDGAGYGALSPIRFTGPNVAAKKGAAAMVIRSIGTDSHRNPHSGNTVFEDGVPPIPAAALANPDADLLERVMDSGQPVRLRLNLTPRFLDNQPSGNVLAEIEGTRPDLPMVLAACHLDSWDLGTGAIDDASGCGIVIAAAKLASEGTQPLRTIRLLLAGAEEIGAHGGADYSARHGSEGHLLALEADFGADRVWAFRTPEDAGALSNLYKQMKHALAPLGVVPVGRPSFGGADIRALGKDHAVPLIDLVQDGTRYFDFHHSPDDTLDKIDPDQLRQVVAAWSTALYLAGNHPAPERDTP